MASGLERVEKSRLRVLRGNTLKGTLGVVIMVLLLLMVLVLLLLVVLVVVKVVLVLEVMVVLVLLLGIVVLLLLLLLAVVVVEEGAMAMRAPVRPGTAILARIQPNRLCKSFQFPCSRLIATDLWG